MALHRNTMQRDIVLKAMNSYIGHPSADDIYTIVSRDYPSISKATVYRNLNLLASEGTIRKIESHSKLTESRYDKTMTIHSHAICRECGKIVDVRVLGESDIEETSISQEDGFELTSHEIIFEGICRECRNKEY